VVRDISDEIIANARKLGIDAIITIGGDGSQKIGHELFQKGLKLVGVPKTIDNDLSATELTFGFDTALHGVGCHRQNPYHRCFAPPRDGGGGDGSRLWLDCSARRHFWRRSHHSDFPKFRSP
jgi:hypothetical protein